MKTIQKPFSIYLETKGPDGRRFACEWETTPTGSLDTSLASFWMLLHASLESGLHVAKHEVVASSRNTPRLRQPRLWKD